MVSIHQPLSYNINDLWILEQSYTLSGVTYPKGEFVTATATSNVFDANHWTKKVKYTDDTLAQEAADVTEAAKERFESWAADGVISPVEKQGKKDEIARIDGEYQRILHEIRPR